MLEIILNKRIKFKGKYYNSKTILTVTKEEFKLLEKYATIKNVLSDKKENISEDVEEKETEKKKRGRKPKEVIAENVDSE